MLRGRLLRLSRGGGSGRSRRGGNGGRFWSFRGFGGGSRRCRSFRRIGFLFLSLRGGGRSRSRCGRSGGGWCHGDRAGGGRSGGCGWWLDGLVTEELGLLRGLLAGGEHGEGEGQHEKEDGEIDGELLEDVRGLGSPDLTGHGIAEGGSEALLARTLHEDDEDEEQADEDFDHREDTD